MRETWAKDEFLKGNTNHILYRADYCPDELLGEWKPSIHLPRKYSREGLLVKEVRVERVQEISEEDARAEGIRFDGTFWLGGTHPVKGTLQCWPTARRAFQAIWDEINAKRGLGWEVNPYCWCVSYMRKARS